MSQTEKSISTPRRCASTLARSIALAERSDAVTAKPFLASPIDWVPIPQATSRMDRTSAPQRSQMIPARCPACCSILASQSEEDQVVKRCQPVVEVVHAGSPWKTEEQMSTSDQKPAPFLLLFTKSSRLL